MRFALLEVSEAIEWGDAALAKLTSDPAQARLGDEWKDHLELYLDAGNVWARPAFIRWRNFVPRATRRRLEAAYFALQRFDQPRCRCDRLRPPGVTRWPRPRQRRACGSHHAPAPRRQ